MRERVDLKSPVQENCPPGSVRGARVTRVPTSTSQPVPQFVNEEPQDLRIRTKAFALRIIHMYSKLPKNDTVAQVLGKQVLRSGTSVGANYREASRLLTLLQPLAFSP